MNTMAYYQLIADVWRFFRKYLEQLPLSDEQWKAEVEEKHAFVDQHSSCQRMALKLITQVEDELEQLDREMKNDKERRSGTP